MSWKESDELKDNDQKYYCSNYYDAIDLSGWFQWYCRYWLRRKSVDNERQIKRWKEIVSRFKGELVEMIKDANSTFDDYSISHKIRQILLQWGYELTKSDLL